MSSASAADRPIAVGADRPPPAAADRGRPPVLVVGLGNPLLGDDAVGWRVVEEVARRLDDARPPVPSVEFDRLAVGGLTLMERLVGYRRVVLVDALATGAAARGSVSVSGLAELATRLASHLDNAHDATLPVALAAGRALGAELPDEVAVVGIETGRVDVFAEGLSDDVAAAVGPAADAVLAVLVGFDGPPDRGPAADERLGRARRR